MVIRKGGLGLYSSILFYFLCEFALFRRNTFFVGPISVRFKNARSKKDAVAFLRAFFLETMLVAFSPR